MHSPHFVLGTKKGELVFGPRPAITTPAFGNQIYFTFTQRWVVYGKRARLAPQKHMLHAPLQ
jgi:hypothetical protein